MAQRSDTNGNMAPYGIGIGDALSRSSTTTEELLAWRDRARQLVGTQGDLVGALTALNAEIERRGAGGKAAPSTGERFVAQVEGLAIPAAMTAEIEVAIEKAVLMEMAKLDTGGDVVATPLSKIRAFAAGPGGHTAGRYISLKNVRSD